MNHSVKRHNKSSLVRVMGARSQGPLFFLNYFVPIIPRAFSVGRMQSDNVYLCLFSREIFFVRFQYCRKFWDGGAGRALLGEGEIVLQFFSNIRASVLETFMLDQVTLRGGWGGRNQVFLFNE